MWYNSPCHTVRNGALFVSSADVFNNAFYWVKHPVLLDNRPADCVTTSASNTGCFIMTAKNGKPCPRCGENEWRNSSCVNCNKAYNREYSRKWKQENKDKVREQKKRYYQTHRQRILGETRQDRQLNPSKYSQKDRLYRERYPEKRTIKHNLRRTKLTEAGGSYTAEEWGALCEQYDNRCVCCGKKKKLTFDHVIPVSKGGTSDISNGQPLCRRCNSSKGDKTTDYRTKPGIKRWIQDKLL